MNDGKEVSERSGEVEHALLLTFDFGSAPPSSPPPLPKRWFSDLATFSTGSIACESENVSLHPPAIQINDDSYTTHLLHRPHHAAVAVEIVIALGVDIIH